MAKFEVVGDIERNGKTFTVLKGIRGTVFSDKDADQKFKDLDGDYFHKSTWFGDDYGITRKFLMYDHGQNDLTNEFPIPDPIIGIAEFKFADDVARWFEVELDKANVMYPAIMELNNLGLLGASSRTLPGKGIMQKSADGALDRWPEFELSFCTVPADARTRYEESDLVTLKSVLSKYLPRIEKLAPQETPTSPAEDDTKKDGSFYISIDGELSPDGIAGILNAASEGVDTEPESGMMSQEQMNAYLMGLVEELINPWKMKVEALEKQVTDLEAMKLPDVLLDHKKGIEKIAKGFSLSVADAVRKMTDAEIAAARGSVPETKIQETPPPAEEKTYIKPRSAFGLNAPGRQ
jgi:hypothetical protein